MQVTKNFKLSELEFSDSIPPELVANAVELLQNLQIIREHFQKPIIIISGYRSPTRNSAVGGADKSQHLHAKAADIKIAGVPVTEIMVGDENGQVSVRKLQKHLKKLPKKLSTAQLREVRARLRSVGGLNLPMPKGPMPTNTRMPKR